LRPLDQGAGNAKLLALRRGEALRRPLIDRGVTIWKPFWLVRGRLVGSRQTGELVDGPVPPEITARKRAALTRALGEPIFEDSRLAVFRRAR
jgi:hypothetical protein